MVKISRDNKTLLPLGRGTFPKEGILERYDFQEYIFKSFDVFCDEIGQSLEIVGKEVKPSDAVGDSIDLLAIDEEGKTVIIELKRGHNKLQLLQAIAYAGMVSMWDLNKFKEKVGNRLSSVEGFLNDSDLELGDANKQQRIVLIAEQYDYEVLAGAKWLHERYAVDITCILVQLALEKTGATEKSEYLAFTQVYPNKELDEVAVHRGSRREASGETIADPEFLAIFDAYNASAPQGMRAEGTAYNFRMIHPADWPFRKFLAYGFYRRAQRHTVELLVHKDAPQGFDKLLAPFDGKAVGKDQATLKWDGGPAHRGGCRLAAEFPSSTAAEIVAQAMHDLVRMTHPIVSNELKAPGAAAGPVAQPAG